MTTHSKLGASGAERWMNCPGSVRLSEGIADKGSYVAAEGSVAHGVAEVRLTKNHVTPLGTEITYDGHIVVVTQEMLDAVEVYRQAVNEVRMPGDKVHVEQKFHLRDIHPDLYGTADCVVWWPAMQRLDVLDFKYGAGVPVEVHNNKQLKYYALGALLELGYPAKLVTVTIVQPRCPHPDGPVRSVTFDAIDLLDFAADLAEAAEAAGKPDAPLRVGDWCRWCPAAGICPEQRKQAQELARIEFSAPAVQPPAPGSLTPVQIADVLEKAPIVEAWIKAVREHAYTQAEAGNPPPRHKLVDKVAHRKFRDGVNAHALAGAADVDDPADFLEIKLKGVTEIEKLMPGKNAKERAAALEPFVVRESSGHVLVHESDRRPAVDRNAAAKLVFQPE